MIPKILGYIIALVGIVGIAIPLVPQIKTYIPIPQNIPPLYITIASLALVGLGLAITMNANKGKGQKQKHQREVPIYEGKEIVGYRRH